MYWIIFAYKYQNYQFIIHRPMQQQLIEQTIQIKPANMNEILAKITQLLSHSTLNEKSLESIVKSLFYGLWNFDKMINQHNLSTAISEILHKIPKKNAFHFLSSLLSFLAEKWNLIDHHRINKFMQLVRYLISQSFRLSHKKTDAVLQQTIFNEISQRSGIADHITDIYFESICDFLLKRNPDTNQFQQVIPFQKLQIFEKILQNSRSLQSFRLRIIQKVYEKLKNHILRVQIGKGNEQKALSRIQQFNSHILELAKTEQSDNNRKNMYALIGFMKSDHDVFDLYMKEKEEKQEREKEKKRKIISKGKKEMIKEKKQKRKEKNKEKKRPKVMSRSRFQFKAREQLNKIME